MTSFFITGTDTGVGKTVVTAGLANCLVRQGKSVCVYKPVQTGSAAPDVPEDPGTLRQWFGEAIYTHCTYNFLVPAAPLVADTERIIDVNRILSDFEQLQSRYDVVLVEGAGGLRVPVTPELDMLELIRRLSLPVIVVSRPDLGTINHTRLTLDVLLSHQVPVHAVVVSGYPQKAPSVAVETLPQVFKNYLPVPNLQYLQPLPLSGSVDDWPLAVFESLLSPKAVVENG